MNTGNLPQPDPAVTVESETKTEATVVTTRAKTSRDYFVFSRRFVYWFLGGFLVTLSIGAFAFFSLFDEAQDQVTVSQRAVADLSADLDKLRAQLGDAQAQLNANSQENSDLIACRGAYNNNVSEKTSQILIELTQLLTLIAAGADTSQAVLEIESAGVELQNAQDARAEFEANGARLPCPIESGHFG